MQLATAGVGETFVHDQSHHVVSKPEGVLLAGDELVQSVPDRRSRVGHYVDERSRQQLRREPFAEHRSESKQAAVDGSEGVDASRHQVFQRRWHLIDRAGLSARLDQLDQVERVTCRPLDQDLHVVFGNRCRFGGRPRQVDGQFAAKWGEFDSLDTGAEPAVQPQLLAACRCDGQPRPEAEALGSVCQQHGRRFVHPGCILEHEDRALGQGCLEQRDHGLAQHHRSERWIGLIDVVGRRRRGVDGEPEQRQPALQVGCQFRNAIGQARDRPRRRRPVSGCRVRREAPVARCSTGGLPGTARPSPGSRAARASRTRPLGSDGSFRCRVHRRSRSTIRSRSLPTAQPRGASSVQARVRRMPPLTVPTSHDRRAGRRRRTPLVGVACP